MTTTAPTPTPATAAACARHELLGCVWCQPNGRRPADVDAKTVVARFPGWCAVCKARIEAGDQIGFTAGQRPCCDGCA